MRLKMDCVRDILLCVEENTGLRKCCLFIDIDLAQKTKAILETFDENDTPSYQKQLDKEYGNEALIYHVQYCIDAELITRYESSNDNSRILISGLTPSGHELIGRIRDNSNWSKMKETGIKIGAFSLDVVSEIAKSVITASITKYLGC